MRQKKSIGQLKLRLIFVLGKLVIESDLEGGVGIEKSFWFAITILSELARFKSENVEGLNKIKKTLFKNCYISKMGKSFKFYFRSF